MKKKKDINEEEQQDMFSPEEMEEQAADTSTDREEEQEEETEDAEEENNGGETGEIQEKYLRLRAEFENYRKRTRKDLANIREITQGETIKALLDVLDDAERAEEEMKKTDDIETVREGSLLIFAKLKNVLKGMGLKEMESLHQEFDPEIHDAIVEIPAPSEDLKGKVVDNTRKGYYLNNRIIRHAKVVVGK